MKTFSINGAAEILERDRRTVTKSLRHVPPDAHEHGQPRWKLPKIVAALAANEQKQIPRRPAYNGPGLPNDEVQALIDDLQDLLFEFDDRCEQLEKLPMEDRFEADQKTIHAGPMIGAVERKMEEINEAMGLGPPDIAGKHLANEMLFLMIDKIMELCDIQIDPKEVEAAQTEYRARVDAEYEEMRAESRARRRA